MYAVRAENPSAEAMAESRKVIDTGATGFMVARMSDLLRWIGFSSAELSGLKCAERIL